MIAFLSDSSILMSLLQASLWLALAAWCVDAIVRRWNPADPRWHRVLWGWVLLLGVAASAWSISLPAQWLPTSELAYQTSSSSFAMEGDESLQGSSGGDSLFQRMHRHSQENPVASSSSTDAPAPLPQQSNGESLDQDPQPLSVSSVDPATNSTETSPSTAIEEAAAASSIDSPNHEVSWTQWVQTGIQLANLVWLSGVFIGLSAMTVSYLALLFTLRRSRRSKGPWQREVDRVCELSSARQLKVLVHPSLGPFVCLTPQGVRLVVPASQWKQLTSAQRRAIIAHELEHVSRGDLLTSSLARIIALVHWFNPMAWKAARKFDEAAEWACDDRLATHSPKLALKLAEALLEVASIPHRQAGLVAAAGGPLGIRVRRLVSPRNSGDFTMRRSLLAMALLLLMALTLVRPQLVLSSAAQEPDDADPISQEDPAEEDSAVQSQEDESTEDSEEATSQEDEDEGDDDQEMEEATEWDESMLDNIETTLEGEPSDEVARFVEVARTPAGRIVLADRGARMVAEQRSEFDLTAWERFVSENFAQEESGLRWNDASARDSFVSQWQQCNDDSAEVRRVIDEELAGVEPETDLHRLILRFMQTPGTEHLFVLEERSTLHPDADRVAEAASDTIVRDRDGRYQLRPLGERDVLATIARFQRAESTVKWMEREFKDWSEEIIGTDERTERLRQGLVDPHLSWYLLVDLINSESFPLEDHLDYRFEALEDATHDVAEGLVLTFDSDGLVQWEELLTEFEQAKVGIAMWDEALNQIANDLSMGNEVAQQLGAFISSPAGRMQFARLMNVEPVTVESLVRERLSMIFEYAEDGTKTWRSEDLEGGEEAVQEGFRQWREIRRRGRPIADTAAALNESDAELAAALSSELGQALMIEKIEQTPPDQPENGIDQWFAQRFEQVDEKWTLQPWAIDDIREFISDVEAVEAQAGEDDF